MKRSSRLLLQTLTSLFFILFLASCTSAGASQSQSIDPSVTPTLEPSPSPTQTLTPEPTFTATVEPTKSPDQIAAGLEGLNQERTYVVRGGYLVDTYNQAPKAVLQGDGAWRELDRSNQVELELMYGHMAPDNGTPPLDKGYIDKTEYMEEGKPLKEVSVIFTGDVVYEQRIVDGQEVTVPFLISVLRDGDNRLHSVKYAVDVIGLDREHTIANVCGNFEDQYVSHTYGKTIEEEIDGGFILPGSVFQNIVFNPNFTPNWYPEITVPSAKYPLMNTAGKYAMEKLYNTDKEAMIDDSEWEALAEQSWPVREVVIYELAGLKQVRNDCGQ